MSGFLINTVGNRVPSHEVIQKKRVCATRLVGINDGAWEDDVAAS